MSWFGEGLSLSSIKGQISNLTKEIVANNVVGLGSNDDSEIEENTEGKSMFGFKRGLNTTQLIYEYKYPIYKHQSRCLFSYFQNMAVMIIL